ncbi:MAG: SpoIIE family protein phosphatase [Lachnospiraceae bacterium]|jgi:stage II sporulation protein E|nr:SpoIIE family protein phosphatase [Lachnospiraceae bacterium]
MNWTRWKEMALYGAAMVVSKGAFAGCYPLIPGFFAACYMEEVNRALLVIFTVFGMALFVPVQAMAKYTTVLLVTAAVIRLAEWANKRCSVYVGAGAAAASVFLIAMAGELLQVRNRETVWIGGLESILVCGMVVALSPILHYFLEGGILAVREAEAGQTAPEHGEKLQTYAKSFNGLSQIFSQMERFKNNFEPEEMGKMQQEIAGKICMSCSQCAICWQEESSPMYELFYRMFHSIEKRGSAEEEVHQELSGYCPYSDSIIEEAVGVFEKAKLNLSWYNRLLENRGVIAEQLDAMAYIMEDCAREYKDISGKEGRLLGAVKYRVKERGIVAKEMHLYERHNGKMSLQMRAVSKWGSCVPVKELAKAVSQGLRRDMVPGRYVRTMVGKDEAFLTFEEDTLFHTLQGVARLTKDNAQVSGDSFSFLELEGGECVMALSDGMGSGIRACKESEMVIELIEKFLEAGFKKETAIRMMNSAMVIQGEEGIFSTVDMAAMDLYTGMCEFYKIGAAATFIKRGGAVECISSGSLPAGMFHQLEIDRASRQLQDGDFVVQVTDGVLDDLHVPSPEETMEEILETIETNNPGQMAKQILERILLFTAGKVPDDMTVLVAGIWEK